MRAVAPGRPVVRIDASLALVFSLLILVFVGMHQLSGISTLVGSAESVARTHEVVARAEAMRGIAANVRRLPGTFASSIAELRSLVAGEPTQVARVDLLELRVAAAPRDANQRTVLTEDVRVGIDDVIAAEHALLSERVRVEQDQIRAMRRDTVIASLCAMALFSAAMLATWREMTSRQRIEQANQELIDLAPDALFVADLEGRCIDVNAAATALLGYSREELLCMNLFDLVSGEDARTLAESRARVAPSGTVAVSRWKLRHKNGTVVPVETSAKILRGGRWMAFARDVTAQVRAEEERVGADRALRAAKDAAEAANRELESFGYSVAHDLRAPVRAIDHYALVTLEDHGAELGGEVKQTLQAIRDAARRMSEQIDDLLSLSRVTRSDFRREDVDLGAIAREVATTLEKAHPEHHVELRIADGMKVNADARLVRIALDNLLANAWKFTAKKAEAHVEIGELARHGNSDGERTFYVHDDGAGFDMRQANRLFGVFQRLHSSKDYEGTGIGLATVQRVVRRHGGRVWAEGEPDHGATFYFSLGAAA